MSGQSMKSINPAYNVALMASAGTGKTYNLALRVAAILMQNCYERTLYDPTGSKERGALKTYSTGKTLCLTFTRKATAEMQSRVHEFLNKIALGNDVESSNLRRVLAESLGINSEEEMKERASRALERIYGDSSIFQARTIDSFITMILKLFPFEANIRPDFRIIDPATEKKLKTQAFIDTFNNLSDVASYNSLFYEYIVWTGEQPKEYTDRLNEQVQWIIERSVTLEKELVNAKRMTVNDLAESLKLAKNYDGLITNCLDKMLVQINSYGIENQLLTRAANSFNLVRSIINGEKRLLSIYEKETTLKNLSPSNIISNKKKNLLPDEYSFVYLELMRHVKNRMALYERIDLDIALHIAANVQKALDKLKSSRGLMSYADLTRSAYRIMNQNSNQINTVNTDYLYFRLDGRLEHLLLDEFQDTSDVQWDILRPLADEAMAGISQSDKSGSFFCVGDPKQTIYRFRGSNPGFFHSVIKQYPDKINKEDLLINHRSDKNIVDFVNELFANADELISGGEDLKFEYVKQSPLSENEGYVSIRLATGENRAEVEEKRKEMLDSLLSEAFLAGWHANEVAILVSKQSSGIAVHKHLKSSKKVKSQLGFAEYLINRPAFVIVEALVEYIQNRDVYSLAKFLLTTPALAPQNTALSELFFERYKILLDGNLAKTQGCSVYNRIMNIGERLSLNRRLGNDPDYRLLMNIIADNLSDIYNLPFFLARAREETAGTAVTGAKADGVQIMTIHGAKGLQFPVVILFDINEPFTFNSSTKSFIDYYAEKGVMRKKMPEEYASFAPEEYAKAIDRERALLRYERINQLYVAATRAKNALIIFVKNSPKNYTNHYILEHFPELYEKGNLSKGSSTEKFHSKPTSVATEQFVTFCWNALLRPLNCEYNSEKTKKSLVDFLKRTFVPPPTSDRVIKHIEKVLSSAESNKNHGTEPYSNRIFGIFLHEIIYQMESFTADAIVAATDKAWRRYGGYIEYSAVEAAKITLRTLLNNEKWNEITNGAAIFREKAIYHDGGVLIVDLYAIKDGRIAIIDFKTGNPKGFRHEEYITQLKRYMNALTKQYGMPSDGYLFYVNKLELQIYSF